MTKERRGVKKGCARRLVICRIIGVGDKRQYSIPVPVIGSDVHRKHVSVRFVRLVRPLVCG